MMRWLSLIALVLLLTACGWHLRGVATLPPELATLSVQGETTPSFKIALEQLLKLNGVKLAANGDETAAALQLAQQGVQTQVRSRTGDGSLNELLLTRSVTITVRDSAGKVMLEPTTLSLQRDVTYDSSDVLGRAREEETVASEMDRELANLVVQRLQSAKR